MITLELTAKQAWALHSLLASTLFPARVSEPDLEAVLTKLKASSDSIMCAFCGERPRRGSRKAGEDICDACNMQRYRKLKKLDSDAASG